MGFEFFRLGQGSGLEGRLRAAAGAGQSRAAALSLAAQRSHRRSKPRSTAAIAAWAQNDAALGRIVETIANSPIWKESLILVTEDDAQNGPDHVDATRTVGLAIGSSIKRGAVIYDRYDQLSLLRTLEVILGLAPLHQGDRLAVPMLGVFTEKPDMRKPLPPQPSAHLTPEDKLRFERLDSPK